MGLGNIWGFPTQAASNGGAAFLITYLLLAFVLAYPALMAELLIGRYTHRNMVIALGSLPKRSALKPAASHRYRRAHHGQHDSQFLRYCCRWSGLRQPYPLSAAGMAATADWLVTFGSPRNLSLMLLFMV